MTVYKLNPVRWDLAGTRFTRHYNKGQMFCNTGTYDFLSARKTGTFVGHLIVGKNWSLEAEPIIITFMTQEMKLLECAISAVGERLSYNAYMVADEFDLPDENELCISKHFANGIDVNVSGSLFEFTITVSYPNNQNRITCRDFHTVIVKTNNPKLVYPVIEYLTTAEGIGPQL